MFESIIMNRTPGNNWEIIADGVDITDSVMGWQVVPASGPETMPLLWLAFMPRHIIMDSKWAEIDNGEMGCP